MWLRIYCTVQHILLIMKICNCEAAQYTNSIVLQNMHFWKTSPPETQRADFTPFGQTPKSTQKNIFYDEDKEENISVKEKPELLKINGVPTCAKDLTYCETISNYPYRQLEEVLRSNFISRELFENEEPTLSSRNSDDYEQVCKSIQKYIVPVAAINAFNEWKYILNDKKGTWFRQDIQIEICKLTKTTHDCGFKALWGYRSICKQKYLYRPLLSFSEDGEVFHDIFKLPSACSCTYVKQASVNKFHKKKSNGKSQRILHSSEH